MKITICNYTPEGIMNLIKKLEELHPNELLSPITLDFCFVDVHDPDENNNLKVDLYDYFDNKNNSAEIVLEDSYLGIDDIELTKKHIILNNKKYKYIKYKSC